MNIKVLIENNIYIKEKIIMSKKLELKTYSNKELAEWFGITANSFSNQKQKKLEELKTFADFE